MKIARRWWDQLDFFAPDVRRDYGRLLTQLERGFSAVAASPEGGEPAGWAGLTRRGSWERLVTSEWALAEVAPEEFVRRATQGELAYWQMAQEARQQARMVWVWVDVGPDQLGACRLVQLAMLFLLQHLCKRSGGQLCWGMIQSPQKGYDRLGAEEVKTYLRSRSLDPGRRPPEAPSGMQSWCLGSPAWLTQVPTSYQRVGLLQTSSQSVEVQYRQRRLTLQMPSPERALRLLRDPFSLPTEPATSSPGGGDGVLRFSQCGRKLMLIDDRKVVLVPLPSSPNEPAGKTRTFPLRHSGRVIAVCWQGSALNVAQENDGRWLVYRQNPPTVQSDGYVCFSAPDAFPGIIGACWPTGGGWQIGVGEQLWAINEADGVKRQFATRGGSLLGSRACLARRDEPQLVNAVGDPLFELPTLEFRRALVCSGFGSGVTRLGYEVALELDERSWLLIGKQGSAQVRCDGNVVGLVHHLRQRQPALLVQHAHHYVVQGADWSEVLDIGFLLAESVVHPDGLLAYRPQGGQIRCHSFVSQAHLWASPP